MLEEQGAQPSRDQRAILTGFATLPAPLSINRRALWEVTGKECVYGAHAYFW